MTRTVFISVLLLLWVSFSMAGTISFQGFGCDSLTVVLINKESGQDTLFSGLLDDHSLTYSHGREEFSVSAVSVINHCDKSGMSFPVLLDGSNIRLNFQRDESSGFRFVTYEGSSLQEEFNAFNAQLNSFRAESMTLAKSLRKVANSDASEAEETERRIRQLMDSANDYIIATWIKDPSNKFVYLFLSMIMAQIQDKKLAEDICRSAAVHAPISLLPAICANKAGIEGKNISEILGDDDDSESFLVLLRSRSNPKWFVIDIWASWCGPCIVQQEELKKHYPEWYGRGVEVIAVAVRDAESRASASHHKRSLPWQNFVDVSGVLGLAFNVASIPGYIVLDDEYTVKFRSNSFEELTEWLTSEGIVLN
ncbi:MAG: TlpA family protein disulfide reductase [Cryomorphaceae bacterium]|nr:MAG: TlpA family protein disulfide reductase [Cryomorphaceae bacterium]